MGDGLANLVRIAEIKDLSQFTRLVIEKRLQEFLNLASRTFGEQIGHALFHFRKPLT